MLQHTPAMLNDRAVITDNKFPGHVLVAGQTTHGHVIIFYGKTAQRPSPHYGLRTGLNFMETRDKREKVMVLGGHEMRRLLIGGNGDHTPVVLDAMQKGGGDERFDASMHQLSFKPSNRGSRNCVAVAHEGSKLHMWMGHVWRDAESGMPECCIVTIDTLEAGVGWFLPTSDGVVNSSPRQYLGQPMKLTLVGTPEEIFRNLYTALPSRFFEAAGMWVYNPTTRAVHRPLIENRFSQPRRA
jgi:hypothetical protein